MKNRIFISLILAATLATPMLAMDVPKPGYGKLGSYSQRTPVTIAFDDIVTRIKDMDSDECEIIELIDQNKQLVTVADSWGTTFLTVATESGLLPVIKHIITIGNELGFDSATAVNHESKGSSALAIAAGKKYKKIVEYLLSLNPSQETIKHAIQVARQSRPSPNTEAVIALLESKLEPEKPKPQPEQPRQQERPWQMPQQQQAPQQIHPGWPDLRPGASARQVLGLPYTASIEDAKKAYKQLARIYHPDKFDENKALLAERGITTKEQATAAIQKINNAWDRLKP